MNAQETINHGYPTSRYVHLSKFLYMNDPNNTQIFTFFLLPHLLCSTLEEVKSAPFVYAEHQWIVSFRKSDTHLGVFLELMPIEHDHSVNRTYVNSGENSNSHIQWRTVTLDFQFTLKNPEHFSRNELFSRRGCTFSANQAKHGRRRFMNLSSLSASHFLFEDGKCVIELELKNADIYLHLWAYQCKDPVNNFPHATEHALHDNRAVKLMRMDGSVIQFDKSLHFETESFTFSDSPWILTLDMEPGQALYNGNAATVNPLDVTVAVEICLVRQSTKSRIHTGSTPRTPNKNCTNFVRIKCVAILPGDCVTDAMEFSIGSQGWPMQAYRTIFKRSASGSSSNEESPVTCKASEELNAQGPKAHHSGSPIALLLSTTSSPFCVGLRILSTSLSTFLEVPISTINEQPQPVQLMDPYNFPWSVRTCTSGRMLRIILQTIYQRPPQQSNKRSIVESSIESQHSYPSGTACVFGMEVRVEALAKKLHQPVCPVGMDFMELIRYNEPITKIIRSLPDRDVHSRQKTYLKSVNEDSDENPQDAFEVVMDITVEQVLDKSSGFVNPLNDTILVEMRWMYSHVIFLERTQTVDSINQRQYIQMRNHLEQIKKERDELEKQVVIKEMGLVQVDTKPHGPTSLLPKEAFSSLQPPTEQFDESKQNRAAVSDHDIIATRRAHKVNDYPFAEYPERYGSRTSLSTHHKETSGGMVRNSPRHALELNARATLSNRPKAYSGQQSFEYGYVTRDFNPRTSNTACATPDYNHSRLPERRKQFHKSKTIWQTYDSYHGTLPVASDKVPSAQATSSSWSTPNERRERQLKENGRLRVTPANYPTRTCYMDHEQRGYFHDQ